ncbi:hypothetical protein [Arthrobacter sp. HY1533]|uniref:hypothetical protein n=1 Tax=Arthrobacter sp. HY1533 TaxID=2970919 RepID=UPI0022B9E08E|nr:hypothetical protein [Arthrobacter sp. HY1533]
MPRPHREIPSQRLAVARTSLPGAAPKPQRSKWWAVGITLAGWALLAYPAFLLAMLLLIIVSDSSGGAEAAQSIAVGSAGFLMVAAMATFPPLLGFAVKTRRRALWIWAITTGALSLAAFAYVLFGWIIPFA